MSGEIDVMENVGFEPGTVHGTLHGPGYSGSGGIGAAYTLPGGQAFADGFHTFAVDWAPNSVKWSVDGNVYQTRTPADVGGNQWAFNKPFFLILNLAVGGYWPGDPDGSTSFPSSSSSTTSTSPPSRQGVTSRGDRCPANPSPRDTGVRFTMPRSRTPSARPSEPSGADAPPCRRPVRGRARP